MVCLTKLYMVSKTKIIPKRLTDIQILTFGAVAQPVSHYPYPGKVKRER